MTTLAKEFPRLFCWPEDLIAPTIQLTLLLDETSRTKRVDERNKGKKIYWDDRLKQDGGLGRRITMAMGMVKVPGVILEVGGQSREQMVQMAKIEIDKAVFPCEKDLEERYGENPLMALVQEAQLRGLCQTEDCVTLAKRVGCRPWEILLASPDPFATSYPVLTNMRVLKVTNLGIIFDSLGH